MRKLNSELGENNLKSRENIALTFFFNFTSDNAIKLRRFRGLLSVRVNEKKKTETTVKV